MATATAKVNSRVKPEKTTKEKLVDAKNKMNEKIRSAKESYKTYKQNIKQAEKTGYRSGARDYNDLPKGVGVKRHATKGYSKAFKDSIKRDKLSAKLAGKK